MCVLLIIILGLLRHDLSTTLKPPLSTALRTLCRRPLPSPLPCSAACDLPPMHAGSPERLQTLAQTSTVKIACMMLSLDADVAPAFAHQQTCIVCLPMLPILSSGTCSLPFPPEEWFKIRLITGTDDLQSTARDAAGILLLMMVETCRHTFHRCPKSAPASRP